MAIYTNYNKINEYMKIGTAKDSCYICARKLGTDSSRDAYDAMRALEGKVENKKVITIRKSGIDACICMDCLKEIYDEHISPTILLEKATAPVIEDPAVTTEEEPKTKTKNTKDK